MRIRRAGVCACALNAENAMQPRVLVLFWNQHGAEPVTGCNEAAQGFDGCSTIMQDCGKGLREKLVTGRRTAIVCIGAPSGGGFGSCAGLRRQLGGCCRSGRSRCWTKLGFIFLSEPFYADGFYCMLPCLDFS